MSDDYDDLFADDEDDDLLDQAGPGLFDEPEETPAVNALPEPEPVAMLEELVESPIGVDDESDDLEALEDPVVQDGPDLFGGTPAPAPEVPTSAPAGSVPADLAAPPAQHTGERPVALDAPLALYRRYRPDTFADVIGQEHVTEPLKRALSNNRVNHAYLFSGPRGCGKTTSARILARALNCVKGPTPEPCGECQSCRDLARGGAGSIDVIEIDAASHGGVDDARDLRERAFFAPVSSRYKIYIVDEAHMVTTAGFNAMLKLVEEPPPHVKFIFATTEPEKVIGTIRSRTHHYPFRLVPPKVLTQYLGTLCEAEGVDVDPTVLPLVVRAGAGSVRDSLSVLDQLLGGAGPEGVSYEQAAALLGYTPDALLDEIMDAFAAGDAQGVFATIDKVVEVGQDPRRFAEDLLRRLRDLVIVAAVPDAVTSGLIDVAGDQAERLAVQAAGMGSGELTRAAEVIARGLTEMRGTTAPRLHLELMCARVLLPGADVDDRGVHARLDRLERRLASGTGVPVAPVTEPEPQRQQWGDVPQARPAAPTEPTPRQRGESLAAQETAPTGASEGAEAQRPAPMPSHQSQPSEEPRQSSGRQRPASSGQRPAGQRPATPASEPTQPAQPGRPEAQTARPAASAPGTVDAARVRQFWPAILDEVKSRRRFSWILLSQNAQVVDVSDGVLTLGFSNPGARDNFNSGGTHDVLADSLVQVLGASLHISPIVDAGHRPGGASSQPAHPASRQPQASERHLHAVPDPAREPAEPAATERPSHAAQAQQAREQARNHASAPEPEEPEPDLADEDDIVVDDLAVNAADLIAQQLGGEVISEE